MPRFSENTDITIPVKNLVAIFVAIGLAATGYFAIDQRLKSLESRGQLVWDRVKENSVWIKDFSPPAFVLDSIEEVQRLELKTSNLEARLKFLENGHSTGVDHQ